MNKFDQQVILGQALRSGIIPGQCPVCNTGLMPSRCIPLANVPNMESQAISFDCPNSREHTQATDLKVYLLP